MYTIRQAAARTGLGAPLIRAWERRYGVVAPTRTPGGYRLYDDGAIRVLLAMRGLVAQGWTASEAARAKLTVFAPTDAAFEALFNTLGVAGVDDIPVPLLRAVLLHHVAPGERSSGDVLGATRIRMLDKSFTHPSFASGIATIDGAAIVIPDVDVSNGVIHVIDAVLLP